jgi:hypothetical protein
MGAFPCTDVFGVVRMCKEMIQSVGQITEVTQSVGSELQCQPNQREIISSCKETATYISDSKSWYGYMGDFKIEIQKLISKSGDDHVL